MKMPENEILFNRYNGGEMTGLVKRLLVDKELKDRFTVQMEYLIPFREPRQPG